MVANLLEAKANINDNIKSFDVYKAADLNKKDRENVLTVLPKFANSS